MKRITVFAVLICCFITMALPVHAAFPTLIPQACTGKAYVNKDAAVKDGCTDEATCVCGLNAIETMALNIAQIILGLAGSLSLLAFVVGGILFTASGGRQALITKGISVMKYALIGIAIILLAGVAVKLVLTTLMTKVSGEAMIFILRNIV